MLRNPAQATTSNLAGIAYVISRMDWYCALTKHLLNKDNITAGKKFQEILHQLEETVVELYKALLLYQMKSVCSYYRNQGLVFLRGMLSLDDWDGDLKLVTDAETIVRNDAAQYYQDQTKAFLGELVTHAEGTETRLGDIHQSLQVFISSQKDARRDKIESDCRRDLRVVDPQNDMARIEKSKDELLEDAYKWILRTPEYAAFTNWDDRGAGCPPRRLLWIKGHAGTGKTMLMIGIIRELSRQPHPFTPSLSFFFCQGTDTALNNATAILRSLIWLLLLQQPCLMSHLLQKYRDSGANLFRDNNAFIALSEAFENMLKDPHLSPVYLAVDALDESEQELDLINLISTSLTLSDNVRWLLSSRPEVDVIAKVIAKLKQSHSHILDIGTLVELDTESLEGPVNAYIEHKVSELRKYPDLRYTDTILQTVSNEVRQRAKDNFLWVSLVFNDLKRVRGSYAVKSIKDYPSGLSKLYDHKMKIIEAEETEHLQRCRDVLVATFLAYRPLSLDELAGLVPWSADTDPFTIVQKCRSFLTITEETVNPIHQSAKDYLKKNFDSIQLGGLAQGHTDIAKRSIDTMSSILRQNMYNLDFGFKLMAPPDSDPLIPIRYSCVFWADHLCSMNGDNPECSRELTENGKVLIFLREHLLHWLEGLSLLGKLSDGVASINKLLLAAQVCQFRPGVINVKFLTN